METALSTIKLMPLSKTQIIEFAEQLKETLESGNVNPLELALYFKAIEETIKQVKDTLSPLALNEAEKYGKSFNYNGASVSIKELGTTYDFSQCNDAQWNDYDEIIKVATELKKQRETFLKSLTDAMTIVNDVTGEIETIYPPIKKSTTGITITIK